MLIDVHSHADDNLLKKYKKAGIKVIVNHRKMMYIDWLANKMCELLF